jgi:eukaryotic-like serine/threonine-protein kinase
MEAASAGGAALAMKNSRHDQIEAVFNEALGLEPGERDAFIARAAGDDQALRKKVLELFGFHDKAGRFLDGRASFWTKDADETIREQPGTVIGRYKLLEQIGEGGFGVVYLAEQQEPVRRQVAFKIIKPGMDTRQVIARFEAERQALALMDHPNIAKVLDGGVVGTKSEIRNQKSEIQTGRPYFVMELVRGMPITRFCEENRLSIKERLDLFIPVCHAIQHAHQKGVIHRDIKPSNVLVTLDNGVPHPMVIDFGVAKAIHQRLTEKTLHTRFAQMIGTPAYMSPEQAEMSKQDVDTRTDVYSLGILLYELLTGTTPFPEERLRTASYAEIQRIISEEEPARPSTVVTRLNGRLRSIALNRRCEPAAFIKLIRGDLDWIVLKAIDKDRNRRYATPNELAADLERHLADEPVTATPPSAVYRLRKLIRRNRLVVIAGTAVLVALMAGLVMALAGFSQATRERQRAEVERDRADQKSAEAGATSDFLVRDLLGAADIWRSEAHSSPNRDVRLLEIVDRASANIAGGFPGQPLVEARIRMTLGSVYTGLGETDQAEAHLRAAKGVLEEAAGLDDPLTLEVHHALAVLLRVNRGAFEEAESLLRGVVPRRTRILGPDHADTLNSVVELAWVRNGRAAHAEAEGLFRTSAAHAERALGANHPIVLQAGEGLVTTLWDRGDRDAALHLNREILETRQREQGQSHPDTLRTLTRTVFYLREHEKDFPLLDNMIEEGLRRSRPVFGDRGPTADLELQRCVLLNHRGLHAASLALRERLWREAIQHAGHEHPATIRAKFYVGIHHVWYGNEAHAIVLFHETLGAWRRAAPDSYNTQRCLEWSAQLNWWLGRPSEALALQRESLAIHRRVYGAESSSTRDRLRELAGFHARVGEFEDAGVRFEELAEMPNPTRSDLIRAALTQALSAPSKRAEHWLSAALERAADVQDPEQILRGVLVAFLVGNTSASGSSPRPERFADRQGLNSRVQEALATLSDAPGVDRPVRRAYQVALSALSNHQWSTALPPLAALEAGARLGYDRATAGFLLAAVLRQHGDHEPARQKYASAESLLRELARTGDLSHQWIDFAICQLARRWAAHQLLGVSALPEIDAAHLAAERQRWLPIKTQLDAAFQHARNRRWPEAAATIHTTMRMPEFSWQAAESCIPRWSVKLALIFARADDLPAYRRVCARSRRHSGLLSATVRPISLFPLTTRGDVDATFLVDGEGLAFRAEYGTERHVPEWRTLISGLSEFQAGDLEAASVLVAQARGAYNLHCACIALGYGAQIELMRAEPAAAARLLHEAKSILGQLQQNQPGDLGRLWFELALAELAVAQAEEALSTPADPTGLSSPRQASTPYRIENQQPQEPL